MELRCLDSSLPPLIMIHPTPSLSHTPGPPPAFHSSRRRYESPLNMFHCSSVTFKAALQSSCVCPSVLCVCCVDFRKPPSYHDWHFRIVFRITKILCFILFLGKLRILLASQKLRQQEVAIIFFECPDTSSSPLRSAPPVY